MYSESMNVIVFYLEVKKSHVLADVPCKSRYYTTPVACEAQLSSV